MKVWLILQLPSKLTYVIVIMLCAVLFFSSSLVINDAFATVFVDSFSVSAQDTSPRGLTFSSDGTKMFVVGDAGDDINEYTLSSAFDVSTASFVDSFSVSAQDTGPTGLAFSSDGTKMFVVGKTGDDVNEYTLSSAFDVSTAVFVDSFSVSAQDTAPRGLAFSSDGTKMFVVGNTGDDVNEYTLSSAFDVSTAVFVDSFSVAAQDTAPLGLAFSSDGTKMFVVGKIGIDINEYTLSSAFDVSTAVFVDSFSVAAQDTAPRGLAFSSDGTKMFVVGDAGDDINEYDLLAAFDIDISLPTLSSVSLSNDNGFNTNHVKPGDIVTVTFTASQTISTPTVKFGAGSIDSTTETNTSGNTWTATYTILDADDETVALGGTTLAFSIAFTDSNTIDGIPVTAVTDNTAHTVDDQKPLSSPDAATGALLTHPKTDHLVNYS